MKFSVRVRATLLGVLAGPLAAQNPATPKPNGPDAAEFDRLDRRAQAYVWAARCAGTVGLLRAQGRFGPIDSLGPSGHCIIVGGQSIGVFIDVDSSRARITRISAVALRDGSRYTAALDTNAMLARTRAGWDAVERGFLYSPDGRTAVSEADAFTKYRPMTIPDTGTVVIRSAELEMPLMSELVLANALGMARRTVTIVTTRYTSSLVSNGPAAFWVHVPRR